MKKTIFISLVVFCLSTTGVRAASILFVTSEDNPLDAEDAPLVTFLAGLGHTVILIDDDEDESTTEAAALQADVVFISESVSSGKIRTEITEIATPMVVAEAWGWDEMGLTTNTTGGLAATSTDIEIVAPGGRTGTMTMPSASSKARWTTCGSTTARCRWRRCCGWPAVESRCTSRSEMALTLP